MQTSPIPSTLFISTTMCTQTAAVWLSVLEPNGREVTGLHPAVGCGCHKHCCWMGQEFSPRSFHLDFSLFSLLKESPAFPSEVSGGAGPGSPVLLSCCASSSVCGKIITKASSNLGKVKQLQLNIRIMEVMSLTVSPPYPVSGNLQGTEEQGLEGKADSCIKPHFFHLKLS